MFTTATAAIVNDPSVTPVPNFDAEQARLADLEDDRQDAMVQRALANRESRDHDRAESFYARL